MESGWFADGSNWCWAKEDANGALACDEAYRLSDKTIAVFDKNCYQATGGWYTTESGKIYYQDQSTGYRAAIGTKTISGKLYLFDAQGVLQAKENWYTSPDGKTYYVQQDGSLLTGKAQVGGSWYGFGKDGVKTESGWFADGSNWCWAKEDADGVLAQNEICLLSDKTYAIFDKDCYQVVQGWYTAENGKTYYQGKASGYRIATGFFTIENKMYYFSSAGEFFLPEQAGWYTKEEKLYYYREDGSIVRPPVIDSVTTTPSSGNKVKVTVKATFVDSAPADQAYSFDGGASWQSSNSKEFTIGTVISAGKIKIKDKQGNIVVYDKALNLSGTSIGFGIDVSAHQGPIDWSAMAQDGVKFAIIRAVTWSGSSIVEDPYFRTNVRQAKENGILVGAYIYSYAYNYSEMAAEVDKFHVAAQALKAEGYALDMPVFIDYEDPRLYNPDKGGPDMPKDSATRTNIVRYGMDRLKGYGYYPGFYTFLNFATQYLNGRQLMAEGYDFWLAHWDVSTPAWTDAELWQYGTAMVGKREVDANYCYKDYAGLIDGSGSGSHIEVEEMLTVYDLNTNKVVTDTVSNILAQIVANEIGNTMLGGGKQVAATGADAQRAYEVQAVAAHSWIVYQYANNHASEVNPPKVGLKSLSTITNVTYRNLITAAVNKVKDDYITYNGEVALTPYYACSGGKTNSSSDYWGQSLPYLVSVDLGSYEKDLIDRTGLKSYLPISMTRTKEQLRADILKVQPKADLSGSLSTWIQPDGKNSAGYYTKVKLGGVETNIDAFYEGVVGPYSLNFTMQVNGEESITFTSYGYGHCVGMSQYAMIQMAALGTKTTAEIATYFFPGTKYTTIK